MYVRVGSVLPMTGTTTTYPPADSDVIYTVAGEGTATSEGPVCWVETTTGSTGKQGKEIPEAKTEPKKKFRPVNRIARDLGIVRWIHKPSGERWGFFKGAFS